MRLAGKPDDRRIVAVSLRETRLHLAEVKVAVSLRQPRLHLAERDAY